MAKKKITKKEENQQEKRFHHELLEKLVSLSTAGFGLVAALAWNEAIQTFVKVYIEPFFPAGALWSQFIYAGLITFLAVLITYQLSKLAAKFQNN